MLEINSRYVAEGETGFSTATSSVPIMFDDPAPPTAPQITYVTDYVNAFDAALMGGSWLDPVTGYAKYVDMQSWADWYIVNELTRNQDSTYLASCKLYKTRDTASVPGKLFMGPQWDSDLSLGNGVNSVTTAIEDWSGHHNRFHTRTAVWIKRMLRDPAFVAVLRERWTLFKAAVYGEAGVIEWARTLALKISAAAAADARRWGYTADNRTRTALVLRWLRRRVEWLDSRMMTPVINNLNPYPRASLGAGGTVYVTQGGATTLALQAGNPLGGGGNSIRATWTTASTSSSGIIMGFPPIPAGTPYTVVAVVRSSVAKSMQLRLQAYDTPGALVGAQNIADPFPAARQHAHATAASDGCDCRRLHKSGSQRAVGRWRRLGSERLAGGLRADAGGQRAHPNWCMPIR